MKPVELVERGLRNTSKTRDTILYPFGGSGNTLIACERANRQARVIEVDPKYCDVTVRRWQQFTGGVARHEVSVRGSMTAGRANARRRCEVVHAPAETTLHDRAWLRQRRSIKVRCSRCAETT